MKKVIVCLLVISLFCTISACNITSDKQNITDITSGNNTSVTNSTTTSKVDEFPVSSIQSSTSLQENDNAKTTDSLPLPQENMQFSFLSGAGGWQSVLSLNSDGSFVGNYHDSEMGSTGEDYPLGTVYICDFSGKFTDIQKIDEYAYKMKLTDVSLEYNVGDEWIKDQIKYVAAPPYGLDGGSEFILYLPETPINTLSENFLWWWPLRYEQNTNPRETLSCYGILNVKTEDGFFSIN